MKYFFVAYALWNVVVMLIYGADKRRARCEQLRISEKTLLTAAFFMGALGAMFGMVVFNHKTSKIRFRILVPMFTILNFALVWAVKNYIF